MTQKIMEKLRIRQVNLSTVRTNLFATAVPESRLRYVVGIFIHGDGTSRLVNIEKLEEVGTWTMLFNEVPISPAGRISVPGEWQFSIDNPFLVCEGGTNLTGISNAGAPRLTIIFYDDIER